MPYKKIWENQLAIMEFLKTMDSGLYGKYSPEYILACHQENSKNEYNNIFGNKRKDGKEMGNYNIIEVTFNNGHSAIWDADKGEWDDYAYDGDVFIVKKGGAWVGIYNMSHVISVVVK